jgi:hypothetical protein
MSFQEQRIYKEVDKSLWRNLDHDNTMGRYYCRETALESPQILFLPQITNNRFSAG